MAYDPSTAAVTARILFSGVMLMCVNENGHCEVGFTPCPDEAHQPKLTIRVIQEATTTLTITHQITNDVYIIVNKPESEGVSIYDNPGSKCAFRWVPDLEGPRLHQGKVKVDLTKIKKRLGVTAGELYTHDKHPAEYDLTKWDDLSSVGTPVAYYGKIAGHVGLNINCTEEAGSGLKIKDNVTGDPIADLQKLPKTWYEINISNKCHNLSSADKTDFRLHYNVVTSFDKSKFDFKKRGTEPYPEICEEAFLGLTESLGLKNP